MFEYNKIFKKNRNGGFVMHKHSFLGILLTAAIVCTSAVYADAPVYNTAEPISDSEEVVAYVNFGNNVESSGMTAWMGEKPDITVTNKQGREGWVLDVTNKQDNAYIYFDVDDNVAKNVLNGSSYRVEVDYYDESISSLVLSYDPYERINDRHDNYSWGSMVRTHKVTPKELELVEFKDTQTWKTYSWYLENPTFSGNMTNGADFRVGAYGYNMGYSRGKTPPVVGSVRLIKTGTRSLVNMTVTSDAHGNNFFDGEEVKLKVSMDNSYYQYESSTLGDWTADVTYSVYDSQGNLYARKKDTARMEVMKTTNKEVTFDIDKYDLYSFIVEIKNEELGLYSRERSVFAYIKDASEHPNPRHGIGAAATIPDTEPMKENVRLIKNAGFAHLRAHFDGSYEAHKYYPEGWKFTDVTWYKQSFQDYMKELNDAGIEVLAYYNGDFDKADSFGNRGYVTDEGRKNNNFLFDGLAGMLGKSITSMEILNEWNGSRVTIPEGENRGSTYAAVCKALYPEMKKKYPDLTIVGMVPSNVKVGSEGETYFREAFEAGAADYMDLISVHFYNTTGPHFTYDFFSEAQNTYDIAREYGYTGPIWVTETGTTSNDNGTDSEEIQGWRDVQAYIIFQENEYFDRIYSFSSFDSHYNRDRNEHEANFGMIEGKSNANRIVDDGEVDWSAKPKYLGFCNLNSLLYDGKYVDKIMFDNVTAGYHFTKKDSGKDIVALFSEKPMTDVSLDLGTNKVTVYDFYGNKKEITSDDGKYTFTLNEAVCYVEGNFARCVKTDTSLVKPSTAYIETDCGEEHTIRLENNTGKTLTAEISLMDESLITCEKSVTIPDGGVDFTLRASKTAPKKDEPVHITIKDGDSVYFDGDVVMYMVSKIYMEANAAFSEGKACIRVTLRNTSNIDANGYIEVVNPSELTEQSRQKVSIPAGTTKDFDIILDESYTAQDLHAMVRFVPDVSESNPIYTDKIFNFEYASKALKAPTIDGDLSDWDRGWIHMNNVQNYKEYIGYFKSYDGIKDLSADVAFMWDEENLYFAAEVTDDIFYCQDTTAAQAWMCDGIQLGFALYPEKLLQRYDFEEIMLVLLDGKPTIYRHRSKFSLDDTTVVNNAEIAITQNEDKTKTYYEFKCPWNDLIPNYGGIKAGDDMFVSICINDNDAEGGRCGAMLYGGGIEDTKDFNKFKRIYINDR